MTQDSSPMDRRQLGWRPETGGGREEDLRNHQRAQCPQPDIDATALQTWTERSRAPVRLQPGFVLVTSGLTKGFGCRSVCKEDLMFTVISNMV